MKILKRIELVSAILLVFFTLSKLIFDIGSIYLIHVFSVLLLTDWIIIFIKSDRSEFNVWQFIERILLLLLFLMLSYSIHNQIFASLGFRFFIGVYIFYQILRAIIILVKNSKNYMLSIEKLLGASFLGALDFRLMHYPNAAYVMTSVSTLILMYFIANAVILSEKTKNRLEKIGVVLSNIGLGLLVISANFSFNNWPGKQLIGLISITLIVLGLMIAKSLKLNNSFIWIYKIRQSAIYIIFGMLCIFSTRYDYLKLDVGYRPQLIEAMIDCESDIVEEIEKPASCSEMDNLFLLKHVYDYPEGDYYCGAEGTIPMKDYLNEQLEKYINNN